MHGELRVGRMARGDEEPRELDGGGRGLGLYCDHCLGGHKSLPMGWWLLLAITL